jgi:hypothetical protein
MNYISDQTKEEFPELKASLLRYKNNPSMKRYAADELKEKRRAKR